MQNAECLCKNCKRKNENAVVWMPVAKMKWEEMQWREVILIWYAALQFFNLMAFSAIARNDKFSHSATNLQFYCQQLVELQRFPCCIESYNDFQFVQKQTNILYVRAHISTDSLDICVCSMLRSCCCYLEDLNTFVATYFSSSGSDPIVCNCMPDTLSHLYKSRTRTRSGEKDRKEEGAWQR